MIALSKPYLYIQKKIFLTFFIVLGHALPKLGHFYKYNSGNPVQKKMPDSQVDVFFTEFILHLFYRVDVKIPSRKLKMILIVAFPRNYKYVIL